MQAYGLESGLRVAAFEYDFSKHGGAVGAISVYGHGIPAGAFIYGGLIHVVTALTSGGAATIACGFLATDDIIAATAVSSWSLNAKLAIVPVMTAASALRMTSADNILTVTVATAALTAGKFVLSAVYLPPTA
jgi:hypothetical protein